MLDWQPETSIFGCSQKYRIQGEKNFKVDKLVDLMHCSTILHISRTYRRPSCVALCTEPYTAWCGQHEKHAFPIFCTILAWNVSCVQAKASARMEPQNTITTRI